MLTLPAEASPQLKDAGVQLAGRLFGAAEGDGADDDAGERLAACYPSFFLSRPYAAAVAAQIASKSKDPLRTAEAQLPADSCARLPLYQGPGRDNVQPGYCAFSESRLQLFEPQVQETAVAAKRPAHQQHGHEHALLTEEQIKAFCSWLAGLEVAERRQIFAAIWGLLQHEGSTEKRPRTAFEAFRAENKPSLLMEVFEVLSFSSNLDDDLGAGGDALLDAIGAPPHHTRRAWLYELIDFAGVQQDGKRSDNVPKIMAALAGTYKPSKKRGLPLSPRRLTALHLDKRTRGLLPDAAAPTRDQLHGCCALARGVMIAVVRLYTNPTGFDAVLNAHYSGDDAKLKPQERLHRAKVDEDDEESVKAAIQQGIRGLNARRPHATLNPDSPETLAQLTEERKLVATLLRSMLASPFFIKSREQDGEEKPLGPLYHGSHPNVAAAIAVAAREDKPEARRVYFPGFMSTSRRKDAVQSYADKGDRGGAVLMVKQRPGDARGGAVWEVSAAPAEEEVLLPDDTQYEVGAVCYLYLLKDVVALGKLSSFQRITIGLSGLGGGKYPQKSFLTMSDEYQNNPTLLQQMAEGKTDTPSPGQGCEDFDEVAGWLLERGPDQGSTVS